MTVDPQYKAMTAFLKGLGTDEVEHSGKGFLAHLIGVYNDLRRWGANQTICRAGLFHSIYGTELFQKFSLPVERRDEVRELIGGRAEHLAYLNCAMDRPTFDALAGTEGPYLFKDRLTGDTHELSQQDYHDLCTIHVCDWIEQVERSGNWDYRREAYKTMAEWLGGIAQSEYRRVFVADGVES